MDWFLFYIFPDLIDIIKISLAILLALKIYDILKK